MFAPIEASTETCVKEAEGNPSQTMKSFRDHGYGEMSGPKFCTTTDVQFDYTAIEASRKPGVLEDARSNIRLIEIFGS